MKIIYIIVIIIPLLSINNSSVKEQEKMGQIEVHQGDCKPSNDNLTILPGILNLEPVTESEGEIYSDSFGSLKNWEKRKTARPSFPANLRFQRSGKGFPQRT